MHGAATAPVTHKVGAIEVTIVSDGVLNVPLSFSLPETPPAEAAALFKAHGLPEGGAPAQTNVVLVKTGNELILIDAGSGPNFQPTAGKLQENLEAAGIAPDTITKVVFTHGHADHLWGAIDDFGDGERFPNASYVISAAEWDFWTRSEHRRAACRTALKGMARRHRAASSRRSRSKIERRKAGDTVAPGLTYLATPGHTPGHMAVLIENGGQRLIVGGDVLTEHGDLVRAARLAHRRRFRPRPGHCHPQAPARSIGHRPHSADRLSPRVARLRRRGTQRHRLSFYPALT